MAAPRLICVATHHKAGTVWIKRVVRAMSASLNIPWIGIWSERQLADVPEAGRAFLCNWHGTFPTEIWARDDVAFLHLIRDPRDVLLSGCAYHQHAGVKGEKFLHIPRDDLEGATYQEHLRALPTSAAKLRFEMGEKHAETLREMRAWTYNDPRTVELRYEEIVADADMTAFAAALDAFGFTPEEQKAGLKAFWDNSLFGGLTNESKRTGRLTTHIASGAGNRWKRELPRPVALDYQRQYGADLIALGYEERDGWAEQLPETPEKNIRWTT